MSTDTAQALTARQGEILEFIRHALATRGAPPTREEIARAFGFRSLNASEQHLQALQRKGLIELLAGTSRGIRLRGGSQDAIGAAARIESAVHIAASNIRRFPTTAIGPMGSSTLHPSTVA